MRNKVLFFFGLIAVSSATNLTATFFAEEEQPCIQECYSSHQFTGDIKLIELTLPEFSLIFDICNAFTITQTCADQCNYTNSLAEIKPFEYLCDSATLSELQKHEVCYTDINIVETKKNCGGQCGGEVDEMAERLHRLMAQHFGYGTNATGLTSVETAINNATVETCRWQKCYALCTVENIGSLCRDSDPEASAFLRKVYEELGFAYYDDLKTMGLADVVKALPEECNFMVEPSTLFDEHANTADPADVNVEQAQDQNEEEFFKQRQMEEERTWSPCLKKCAADLNYEAEMDRFEKISHSGDYAEQFLSLHSMCRANNDLNQCLNQCNGTSVNPDDMKLTDALCDKQLFIELQAHEQCYSKSREAKTECQERCSKESEGQEAEATPTATVEKETCRMRKCQMRCHYDIVAETCDETDPEASKLMLHWFDQMRRGSNIFLGGEVNRESMQAVLSETPEQCHYFINHNITLFDGNSSVRCSLTNMCLTFLLLFVSVSFFNDYFLH